MLLVWPTNMNYSRLLILVIIVSKKLAAKLFTKSAMSKNSSWTTMISAFQVRPNLQVFAISYLLFFILRIFCGKKNSAGSLVKTKYLMKKLNIAIWQENLCASESANFHQPHCFSKATSLIFLLQTNSSSKSRSK